ncbi:MAG: hypothetical protein C4522_17925 [Desulfobacteraceae bacterium]|nr:MAG: hypothetical protein C4522_17925 [Desulfobacteraceae bacterium]
MALGNLFQILADGSYFIYFPFRCWRFLLSQVFRKTVYEKWNDQRPMIVVQDVIGMLVGFVVSIFVVGWLIYYFFVKDS